MPSFQFTQICGGIAIISVFIICLARCRGRCACCACCDPCIPCIHNAGVSGPRQPPHTATAAGGASGSGAASCRPYDIPMREVLIDIGENGEATMMVVSAGAAARAATAAAAEEEEGGSAGRGGRQAGVGAAGSPSSRRQWQGAAAAAVASGAGDGVNGVQATGDVEAPVAPKLVSFGVSVPVPELDVLMVQPDGMSCCIATVEEEDAEGDKAVRSKWQETSGEVDEAAVAGPEHVVVTVMLAPQQAGAGRGAGAGPGAGG